MKRLFLTAVGIFFFYQVGWLQLNPNQVSQLAAFNLGCDLKTSQGQQQFLLLYGGLESALMVILLWPLFRPKQVEFSLLVCLIVHAGLVLFRSVSFFLHSDIQPMTYKLAVGEWIIFLGAMGLVCRRKKTTT